MGAQQALATSCFPARGGCDRLGAHLLCPQSWQQLLQLLIQPLPEQRGGLRASDTRSSGTKPALPIRGLPMPVPLQLVPGSGTLTPHPHPLTAQHRVVQESNSSPALTEGQPQGGLPPGHPRPGAWGMGVRGQMPKAPSQLPSETRSQLYPQQREAHLPLWGRYRPLQGSWKQT